MNWRWRLFWVRDKFSGGKVKEAYDDLSKNYENFDKEEQTKKLDNILKYATNCCSFYKDKGLSIKDFPVINKQIIKDNLDKILVNKYAKEKLHKMSTSGSTGTPFTVYQDSEKRNRVIAEVIFYGKITGYYFGQKQIFFRSWTEKNRKNFLQKFLQNMVPFDITKLNDNVVDDALNLINSSKNLKSILSYASTLDRLGEYASSSCYNYDKNSIVSFISSSELLSEETRDKINKIFHCRCYSRYSNQENGILGQDNGVEKTFILNETDYYFEFLRLDSDEPANEGEISRIVVTDLFNHVMPLIRYDTGDLAVYKKEKNKLYIKELYGRRQDMIYDTNRNPVSPDGISVHLWSLSGVKQWQFIQKNRTNYQLLINSNEEINEKEVVDVLKEILGLNSDIKIQYVDDIPILSSGKFKYIVNEENI